MGLNGICFHKRHTHDANDINDEHLEHNNLFLYISVRSL